MDISVALIVASLHMQGLNTNPGGYDQFNPGVAIEVGHCYEAGVYRDSYKKVASFLTYTFRKDKVFRPFVGVVEGYQGHIPVFGKIGPAAGLGIEPYHEKGPVFTLTPMNKHGIVIGFALKVF